MKVEAFSSPIYSPTAGRKGNVFSTDLKMSQRETYTGQYVLTVCSFSSHTLMKGVLRSGTDTPQHHWHRSNSAPKSIDMDATGRTTGPFTTQRTAPNSRQIKQRWHCSTTEWKIPFFSPLSHSVWYATAEKVSVPMRPQKLDTFLNQFDCNCELGIILMRVQACVNNSEET